MEIYTLNNNNVTAIASNSLPELTRRANELGYMFNYKTAYAALQKKDYFSYSFDVKANGIDTSVLVTICKTSLL